MKQLIAIVALIAGCNACNATPGQVTSTVTDGINVAACVLGQVFVGITDPAQLLSCTGATEALIVQIIDDFLAQRATDAGMASAASTLTSQQLQWLQQARANAVAALAKHASSK